MNFFEVWAEDIDKNIAYRFPVMKFKLKDTFKGGGKSIPYSDLSKCIVIPKDDTYDFVPKFAYESKYMGEGVEVDITPFLAVGAMEIFNILYSQNQASVGYWAEFLSELSDSLHNPTWDVFVKMLFVPNRYDKHEWFGAFSRMKSPCTFEGYSTIKDMVNVLLVVSDFAPQLFYDALLDMARVSFSYGSIFSKFHENYISVTFDPDAKANKIRSAKKGETQVWDRFTQVGAVKVKHKLLGEKPVLVTDSRGASIYMYLIWVAYMFQLCGNFSKNDYDVRTVDKEAVVDFNERLVKCLGEDAVSRYLTKGKQVSVSSNNVIWKKGLQLAEGVSYTTEDKKQYFRDDIIDHELFKRAYKVRFKGNEPDESHIYDYEVNMNYASMTSLGNGVGYCVNMFSDINFTEFNDQLNKVIHENERLRNQLETIEEKNKKSADESKSSYEDAIVEKDKRIAELEQALAVKSDNFNKLYEEYESYQSEMNDMLSQIDDIEELVDEVEDVPIEEMIDFLNDYKFAMIGGHVNMHKKLKELGLTNTVYIEDINRVVSGVQSVDFVCLFTKLCSHKHVRAAQSMYTDMTDRLIYINQQNTDIVIKICYSFVKKWLEG